MQNVGWFPEYPECVVSFARCFAWAKFNSTSIIQSVDKTLSGDNRLCLAVGAVKGRKELLYTYDVGSERRIKQ